MTMMVIKPVLVVPLLLLLGLGLGGRVRQRVKLQQALELEAEQLRKIRTRPLKKYLQKAKKVGLRIKGVVQGTSPQQATRLKALQIVEQDAVLQKKQKMGKKIQPKIMLVPRPPLLRVKQQLREISRVDEEAREKQLRIFQQIQMKHLQSHPLLHPSMKVHLSSQMLMHCLVVAEESKGNTQTFCQPLKEIIYLEAPEKECQIKNQLSRQYLITQSQHHMIHQQHHMIHQQRHMIINQTVYLQNHKSHP